MARNKYPKETVKLILDVSTRLFSEKGYDDTSLQDIINETKLSKGAIYHHFSSKEDILKAIFHRLGNENAEIFAKIRDDSRLSGIEKLRKIFQTAVFHSNQSVLLTVSPCLLNNPRFLAMQIEQIYELIAPQFVEPILTEGVKDGSINIENPHEIAEAIMILTNVWLNPLVKMTDTESMKKRCDTFNTLLKGLGIDGLLDNQTISAFVQLCNKK
ncbi:HTH-type transcriptional repressor AcnR [Clostridioides difficile]|uniref:TetR/AcrR family transcriptional regulator n=1 Tax=Clostridioides difficile TaxID=1496 RepID=UPI000980035B|nr:TetR/AcrR family transcriptional regulator [Clostridioides difficile]SJN94931.1 HTH-type transcriptional repressor AcnR [Clostridioides difficile]